MAWPVGTYLDNLKTNLETRLAASTQSVDNVEVYTAPIDREEIDTDMEGIVLGITVETDEEIAAMKGPEGHRNEESNRIECQLMAWELVSGASETAAKEARDRAILIMGIVETELRVNMRQGLGSPNMVRNAVISRKSLDQGVYPAADGRARACAIEFDITLTLRTDLD